MPPSAILSIHRTKLWRLALWARDEREDITTVTQDGKEGQTLTAIVIAASADGKLGKCEGGSSDADFCNRVWHVLDCRCSYTRPTESA